MLKISRLARNKINTNVISSFGVVSKDSHSKDTEVLNSHNIRILCSKNIQLSITHSMR